ncbi:hypothetical protein ACFV4E_12380, partial [Streptomyces hygroscopicus]|uniref:hypothetical protein n=1 Tax=Streptomyces hygroscopicus TaxID=1912 RepID=UPI0036889FE2
MVVAWWLLVWWSRGGRPVGFRLAVHPGAVEQALDRGVVGGLEGEGGAGAHLANFDTFVIDEPNTKFST